MSILEEAREVLEIEAQGILNLIPKLGTEFEKAVEAIYSSKAGSSSPGSANPGSWPARSWPP